ncbi:MAG: bifunctional phosphopantothenoylcysteine decarboxylase/phosphopantothenate--cysteine ligase CoaBC [Chitinophagaceae bacterium]
MLQQKKILLGITGSIAAYKAVALVRLLVKKGADVKIIMTSAATDFVSKLTLATLSKNEVLIDMFKDGNWSNHVQLGRWADVMMIAPLSCNSLGKLANGITDNLLNAVFYSATCPVVLAPAMDEDMWKHQVTQLNLKKLKELGSMIMPVRSGELASGLIGEGRMEEPEAIVEFLELFFQKKNLLSGKKAMVSAGPTYEPIDPVRYIGNHSSGKMGVALAKALQQRGAEVTLILGPTHHTFDLSGLNVIRVGTAQQMKDACMQAYHEADIAVMAAAVADYTPAYIADEKVKKKDQDWSLQLKKTEDILKELGLLKREHQVLVGFALETNDAKQNALKKLNEKNADIIVLNSLEDSGAGFEVDTNKVIMFLKNGKEIPLSLKTKVEIADEIVNTILDYVQI